MDKILVVRYGTIGDSIFASAFYRELRRNLKNATIDILSDSVSTGVMKNCPYIDNIVKINGDNNYSYSQIGSLTGYSKLQIINFSKQLNEKDISSLLVHGLTDKPSNNSPSPKEIEFIKNYKESKYPVISIQQFMDIYHEDVIWNKNMSEIINYVVGLCLLNV